MNEVSTEPQPILVLVSDLIFSSRISAEARAAGSVIRMIRQPGQLVSFEQAAEMGGILAGRMLIVDLNMPGAIVAASAWRKGSGRPVVGFVGHTDQATIEAAREAGIDQVMARSRFVQVLGEMLRTRE